jgi:hypothetical protein
MTAENLHILPEARITNVKYLTGGPKKMTTSIVITFTKAEDANTAIRQGIIWKGGHFPAETYEPGARIKQCYNCQKYGHIASQCSGTKACQRCAKPHAIQDCPEDKETGATKCGACRGDHTSLSEECPARRKEKERAMMARLRKPDLFPEEHRRNSNTGRANQEQTTTTTTNSRRTATPRGPVPTSIHKKRKIDSQQNSPQALQERNLNSTRTRRQTTKVREAREDVELQEIQEISDQSMEE